MQRALSRLRPLLRTMSYSAHLDLSKYTTCEVSDALIRLGVPHGGHLPDIHMLSPAASASDTRICGPAYTVQMVLAVDTAAPKPAAHFVDTAPAGAVIVVAAPPRSVYFLSLYRTAAESALVRSMPPCPRLCAVPGATHALRAPLILRPRAQRPRTRSGEAS